MKYTGMNKAAIRLFIGLSIVMCGGLVTACNEQAGSPSQMAMDPSDHDMSAHDAERDELGRRLHGMNHNLTPEILEQLQTRIRGWENFDLQEATLRMQRMGANYEWYISADDVSSETGVLILLHGFRDRGDKVFMEQVRPYAEIFPTAIAPGMSMAMSRHIQLGVDDLVAAGAERIVVIPVVSTEYNSMIRQWQYIFGLIDTPPYATVPQIETDAKILFASPPGDDPLVAEILLDFALEISEDPANEIVVIVAHGPGREADNLKQLAQMDKLAKIVKEDGRFMAVRTATLQDDSSDEVREANVAELRRLIADANEDGKQVLVVTSLIGAYTIQRKLRKDLDGLDYRFNAKGLVQHDLFIQWIGDTVSHERQLAAE